MADLAPTAAEGWLADYRARLGKRGRTAGSPRRAGRHVPRRGPAPGSPGHAYAGEDEDTGTEHRPGEMVTSANQARTGKAAFAGASPPGTGGANDVAARNPALLKGKGGGDRRTERPSGSVRSYGPRGPYSMPAGGKPQTR